MPLTLQRTGDGFNKVVDAPDEQLPAFSHFLQEITPDPRGYLSRLAQVLKVPHEDLVLCLERQGRVDRSSQENIRAFLKIGMNLQLLNFLQNQAGLAGRKNKP